MNTNSLNGRLELEPLAQSGIRIVALDANGAVCAETMVDRRGRWSLSTPVPIAWVIAQLTQGGIAASLTAAADAAELRLPRRYPCRVTFASTPAGARLWVDPVSLDGFPDEHLPALRLHPDATMDLHLGDYACEPGELVLHLQTGRYRVVGGRIALHPAADGSDAGLRVGQVEDARSGRPLASSEFVLTAGGLALRVSFEPSGGRTL